MEKEAIIRKVNALMQVTVEHGASVHEALTATTMAQKLMAKYHIEAIDIVEEKENIDEEHLEASRKWIQQLASIVAQNMCCQVLISHTDRKALLKIIGRESDRKVVLDTINMLISVCRKGIKNEKVRAKNQFGEIAGVEIAYAAGFVQAVREEMSKQCKALMLMIPDEVKEHINQKYPNIIKRTPRNTIRFRNEENIEAARENGYAEGKNVVGQRQISN